MSKMFFFENFDKNFFGKNFEKKNIVQIPSKKKIKTLLAFYSTFSAPQGRTLFHIPTFFFTSVSCPSVRTYVRTSGVRAILHA